MDMAAEDDGERQRNRSRLYAPPAGVAKRDASRARAAGAGMTGGQARAMVAQLAAEDAKYGTAGG